MPGWDVTSYGYLLDSHRYTLVVRGRGSEQLADLCRKMWPSPRTAEELPVPAAYSKGLGHHQRSVQPPGGKDCLRRGSGFAIGVLLSVATIPLETAEWAIA